jgi:hypothetical protein
MLGVHRALLLAAEAEDYWTQEFFGLDAGQRFVVILTAIGCLTAVIITLAGIAYSWIDGANRRRLEAEMKRDMLDRGMTAEEITKVIEAAGPPEDATERWIASWCHKKK